MASSTIIKAALDRLVASPQDALNVLDALEDIALEGATTVEEAWSERSAGRPWRAISKTVERCRIGLRKRLYKMGAVD